MLSYRCSNRGLVLLLLFACFSIFSCQKDIQPDQDSRQNRDITIYEVKDAYNGLTGAGLHERSGMRLPMNAVPVWEYPYMYYVDAGLSYGSMVPFAGWTTYGTKYARKIVTALGKSTELRYVVRSSDKIIQFGWDLAEGRKQLRRILGTPSGWEAHHIIPWEHREHPVIQAAAHVGSNNAFHMNELLNGISLPKTGGGCGYHSIWGFTRNIILEF